MRTVRTSSKAVKENPTKRAENLLNLKRLEIDGVAQNREFEKPEKLFP
jgi:hypothetical protein